MEKKLYAFEKLTEKYFNPQTEDDNTNIEIFLENIITKYNNHGLMLILKDIKTILDFFEHKPDHELEFFLEKKYNLKKQTLNLNQYSYREFLLLFNNKLYEVLEKYYTKKTKYKFQFIFDKYDSELKNLFGCFFNQDYSVLFKNFDNCIEEILESYSVDGLKELILEIEDALSRNADKTDEELGDYLEQIYDLESTYKRMGQSSYKDFLLCLKQRFQENVNKKASEKKD